MRWSCDKYLSLEGENNSLKVIVKRFFTYLCLYKTRKMSRPKVSVIISVYNVAPYVESAVRSVMSQTLDGLEIVLVDDGSTDGSVEILRRLAAEDSRICLLEQSHKGRPMARNAGLEKSTGEYVYFMNSLDELNGDNLGSLYRMCKKQHLNFVFFDGDVFGDDHVIVGHENDYHRTSPYNEIVVYKGLTLFDDMLDNKTYRPEPWLLFINRTTLNASGVRFYPGIIHDDELFTSLLYIQSDRVGCVRKSIVKHRLRKEDVGSKIQTYHNLKCYLTVLDELFAYAGRFPYLYPHIRKYASHTLNPVFSRASLSFMDKMRAMRACASSHYFRYLRIPSLLKFWFKN